jgi:hypothetical protein
VRATVASGRDVCVPEREMVQALWPSSIRVLRSVLTPSTVGLLMPIGLGISKMTLRISGGLGLAGACPTYVDF